MALPVANDIRTQLEGYCIDSSMLSDPFINNRINNFVIPYVEDITRQSVSGIKDVIEYRSGTGTPLLYVSRRPINTLVSVKFVTAGSNITFLDLTNIEVIKEEGLLKSKSNLQESWIFPLFPRGEHNIKVEYTYGFDPASLPLDIFEAITLLSASTCLTYVSGRFGGGDLGIKDYTKTYGKRGKYTDIRNELDRMANRLLRKYMTGTV